MNDPRLDMSDETSDFSDDDEELDSLSDDEVEWEVWMEDEGEEESSDEESVLVDDEDGVVMLQDTVYSANGPEGPRDPIFLNLLMRHVVLSNAHYHYDPDLPLRGFFRHAVGSAIFRQQALSLRLLFENELILNLAFEHGRIRNADLPTGFHSIDHSTGTVCVRMARDAYALDNNLDVVGLASVYLAEFLTDPIKWMMRASSMMVMQV